ncbi:MAG: RHS repeat-associated core domain-containing protein, partial [Candidatus Acidiferrales bacterium]
MAAAWSTGGLWGETYSTDAWGNMNQFLPYQNAQGQTLPSSEITSSLAANPENRVIAYCYDTAGNVLDQSGCNNPQQFTYNAENQLTLTASTYYTYDGDGNRVEKAMPGTTPPFYELYWYGGGSAPLDETDGTGSATNSAFHEYIFFNGARIARRDSTSSGDVEYYFGDQLGSARVVTNATGTLQSDIDYCPYGGECYVNTDTSGNNYKFTGKERDTESGLDNFEARYNASSQARFMSPDPAGMFAVSLAYPQTLNRYSYVLNSPVSLLDPLGLDCAYLNDAGTGIESVDQNSNSDECGQNGGYWV